MGPNKDGKEIFISQREITSPDEADNGWGPTTATESADGSITPRDMEVHDIIMGQDPSELVDVSEQSLLPTKEMQEKPGTPNFGSAHGALPLVDGYKKSNIGESMDVDDIVGN
jgi:hypothetical protein